MMSKFGEFLSINKENFLIILSTIYIKTKMYQRKQKDNFRNKIDQIIIGHNKRSCNSNTSGNTSNSSDNCSSNTFINNSNNCSNDTFTNNGNFSISDIPTNNSNSFDINRLRVTRWLPANEKIEGIRKFGINAISDY